MIMGSITEVANDVRKNSSEEINTEVANGFHKKGKDRID